MQTPLMKRGLNYIMFFDLKFYNSTADAIYFSSKTAVNSSYRKYKQFIDETFRKKLLFGNGEIERVDFVLGFPDSVKKQIIKFLLNFGCQHLY